MVDSGNTPHAETSDGERVTFQSPGGRLAGVLHRPTGMRSGDRRPAFALLHGFASNKDSAMITALARLLVETGCCVLRFDARGCGESEGQRGWITCEDQVEDLIAARAFLSAEAGVNPEAVGVMGHSFGAAVASYAAGVDSRIAACVSLCGWGDGRQKMMRQHAGRDAWERFEAMVVRGREHRARTGQSLMVSRFEIVPMPEHLRHTLPADAILELPTDTPESVLAFKPNSVAGKIAPRPILIIHGGSDSITPADQSIDLFNHSAQPADLVILSGMDHYPFADDERAAEVIRAWVTRNLVLAD